MMKVKNTSPFFHGYRSTYREARKPELTLLCKATFRLAPGQPLEPMDEMERPMLQDDVFADDDADKLGALLYASDIVPFKPACDVLLTGTAYAPGGKPTDRLSVAFRVGGWRKELLVIGPRVWKQGLIGAKAGDPVPFLSMPLTWDNAFGGEKYKLNPIGKGHGDLLLPTIEYADYRVKAPNSRVPPACFAPINPAWTPRASLLGKKWAPPHRPMSAPWMAPDFDFGYYNAAPDDQQFATYLRGDEPLAFENLHPTTPKFETKLPGFAVRAFVRLDFADGSEPELREVEMVIDTLHVDLDKQQLNLVWRGLTPVKRDEFEDVKFGLIEAEPLEAPKPREYYLERFKKFEADPIGLGDEMIAAHEAYKKGGPSAAKEALLKAKGIDVAKNDPAAMLSIADKATGKDLGAAAKLRSALGGASAQADPALAKAGKPGLGATIAAAMAKSSAAPSHITLSQAMAKASGAAKLLSDKGVKGAEGLLKAAHNPALQKLVPGYKPPAPAKMGALEKINVPKEVKEHQEKHPPKPAPVEGEVPEGAVLADPGEDCTGRNYDEQDLSGRDLSGTVFADASFVGANLEGANLSNCILTKANLRDANLTGACLDGAVMSEAFFDNARLWGASLNGVDATWASFRNVNLEGAIANDATLDWANFTDANMTSITMRRSSAESATLANARLVGAILRTSFHEAKAPGARFDDADMEKARMSEGDFSGASFRGAKLDKSIWQACKLDGAVFAYAAMNEAQMQSCSAREADFTATTAKKARMRKCNFSNATFTTANLIGADLSKCNVAGTKFFGTNLYGVKFVGADPTVATFDHAIVDAVVY